MSVRRLSTALAAAATLLAAVPLGGGALFDIRDQAEAVADTGRIAGRVTASGRVLPDVVVALFRKGRDGTLFLQGRATAGQAGRFLFTVTPGEYYLAAYVDANRDSRHQPGEPGRFLGEPSPVSVAPRGEVLVELDLDSTIGSSPVPQVTDAVPEIGRNVGRVTTLDDPRFAPPNGALGLWRPVDFLAGPAGGLFLLEPYDPARRPVIFVHGIAATPLDWAATIATLDRARVQPWVLYYPSGVRLDMVSDYFVGAVVELQRRLGFASFDVVAHSMGGLVARSFVQKYRARHPDAARALRRLVTVNSPLGGLQSAAVGVENSPIVVPAWYDVAAGSEFVAALASRPWPADLDWHLVFSFLDRGRGDGTVTLESQLPRTLQEQATRLHGFKASHVGTLADPGFHALLGGILADDGAGAGAAAARSAAARR